MISQNEQHYLKQSQAEFLLCCTDGGSFRLEKALSTHFFSQNLPKPFLLSLRDVVW